MKVLADQLKAQNTKHKITSNAVLSFALCTLRLYRPSLLLIRNSFRSTNRSIWPIILRLFYPLIMMASFIFLYSFITRSPGPLSPSLTTYFIIVLATSSLETGHFKEFIQITIQRETYLDIDRLPMPPFWYFFCWSLGRNVITLGVLTAIALIYAITVHLPGLLIILLIPTIIVAILLTHLIFFMVALLNFFAPNLQSNPFSIIFEFLAGQLLPLSILPATIRTMFLILPFAYTAGALAQNFSNRNPVHLLLSLTIAVFWIIIALLTSQKLWLRGSAYYQEHG